jgi:FkbM family methyltransferase
MGMLRRVGGSWKDLADAGPQFWLGGLRAWFGSSARVPVVVPGKMCVSVRPRTSDFSVLRQIFRNQEYALTNSYVRDCVQREYLRILANGQVPVIVDAGANIGAASIWFHQQFPDAWIVAIEPDAANAEMARGNTAHLDGILVLQAAVGGERGFVAVVPGDAAWGVQTERSTDGCEVLTIADAIARVPDGVPLIVKVDIEGFEADVFDGNTDWIDDTALIFVEPHDWMLPGKGTSRSFQRAFGTRGFEIFIQGENLAYLRGASVQH